MATHRRSLNDIEAELDQSRERMGRALDALGERLSGDQIFERGMGYLRSTGAEEFAANLRASVVRNPLPLTVCSVGMIWLMVAGSDTASRAVSDYTSDYAGSRIGSTASDASEGTQSVGDAIRDGANRAASSSSQAMHQISDSVRRNASRAGAAAGGGRERIVDGLNYMRREQPMLSAALGLAIGAVVAASLPRTLSEDQALGSARDDFLQSARETGAERAKQAGAVAESAVHAASDAARSEASRQGLHTSD